MKNHHETYPSIQICSLQTARETDYSIYDGVNEEIIVMKNILVTGGSGFIGSNFVNFLIEKGFKVINLDKLTYAGNEKNNQHLLFQEK